jgi:hypothetical protein
MPTCRAWETLRLRLALRISSGLTLNTSATLVST